MKKCLSAVLVLLLAASFALAEEASSTETPADALVSLPHSAVIQGETLHYTSTAGMMAVDTAAGNCEIFFTAYTLDGAEDPAARPLTFVFNGGPGSSSQWLHMGCLGPRRIAFDENGQVASFPAAIVDNEYSILSLTDLVFIDPVGTGYSRPAEGVGIEKFVGYANDILSVGDFIRLYTNRYGRWSSPKYLAGESYGTTRAIGLAQYLADMHSMNLNGIMLISAINDLNLAMESNDNDTVYAVYLPTYAADAWYHGRLDAKYQEMALEDFLSEVRTFAGGAYLSALSRGRKLDEATLRETAARMAAYTGLDADQIIKANLRVYCADFCKSLLSDQKLVIGRIDGRYTGPLTGGDISSGDSDPSSFAMNGIYGAAINQYIGVELGYQTDRPYESLSSQVNSLWSFPQAFGEGFTQEKTIREIMSKNRFLKIWVLCGYYDMATPFYAAEWVYDHVFLNKEYESNLQFTYYPSGHMIYMHEPSLAQFRKDAGAWYSGE